MTGYIYSEAMRVIEKHKTRDPFELLDGIGAITVLTRDYERDGLKGFSTILNRTMYAIINVKLRKDERRIAAGHEAAHLILHKNQIFSSPIKAMRDFNLFDYSGRYEREANSFLADFLLDDADVMDVVTDENRDYFSSARELRVPPPLFAFKLYSMMQRGFNVRNPVDLDSNFLAHETEV